MTLNERIGLQFRILRLEKRMSIEQVADLLGVAKNTVSYMELGKKKITVDDVITYAEIFGVDWISILEKADQTDREYRERTERKEEK